MHSKLLKLVLLGCVWFVPLCELTSATAAAQAAQQVTVLNRHLAKLLGTWTSAEGEVTFNANGSLIYKGKKGYCAIAQGTIQISNRHTTVILPYRFVNDNLLITDSGTVTTYKRVLASE